MKVFQQIQEAIQECQDSRSLLISIARSLNCNEDQILDRIESLKEARPASDLNVINEGLDNLREQLEQAMDRAENLDSEVSEAQSQLEEAQSQLEYVDAGDAVSSIEDVTEDLVNLRDQVRKQLEENKG